MKKRFARIMSAVVCFVLCALCFTACGDKKPKSEITESNWTAVFGSVLGDSFSYSQYNGASFIHIKHDSFKTEVVDTFESPTITKYYFFEDNTYYIQERLGDFGAYTRRTVTITQLLDDSKKYLDLPDIVVNGLKDKFSSFSFDENCSDVEYERYTAENIQLTGAGVASEVEIYINKNNIKEIFVRGYTPENSESTIELLYLGEIGLATVNIPQDVIDDTPEIAE